MRRRMSSRIIFSEERFEHHGHDASETFHKVVRFCEGIDDNDSECILLCKTSLQYQRNM